LLANYILSGDAPPARSRKKDWYIMSKKMLINVMHPEEARIAIVEDGLLVELDIEIEGSEQTRGNVYKGVVVRVEQGLQAAFVDIGLKKLGFLQMGELHPDYWQWRDDVPEEQRKRRPRIQEVLRRGQELIVQVEKGERDMKGAAVTTYCSFPGRYMVIMPGSDSAGVSRKVENEGDRKKLKEMAADMKIPEGIGHIIRTEALGKTKTELNKDLKSLLKLNQDILAKAKKLKAPALIYQELDLVIRTIRDYFTAEIDEVLVDNPEVYQQAREFFKATMPKHEQIVKLHQEKRPIFSKYQLEEQIDQIYEKKVPLKSGGSLIIEPTEALVSIDVNSGKSTGERGVEDTAYKTNLEAAEEAARQLRLRDLAGLIVIDFIDMRDKKHMIEVEKVLKNALKQDKARVTVGRISQFGMLEMSRQRIKQTLEQASYLECPHCGGRGKVKSVENMALSFLRKVHASAAKGTTAEVRGGLPLEVAYFLLNRKKRELAQIENDYDIEVTIKGKPSFLMNQLELELVKRDRQHYTEAPAEQAAYAAAPAEVMEHDEGAQTEAAPAGAEEGKGKKKRRRKKKAKGDGEAVPHSETPDAQPIDLADRSVAGSAPDAEEAAGGGEASREELHGEEQKKRKRKRRRGAKGHPAEGSTPEIKSGAEPGESGEPAEPAESTPEKRVEQPGGETPPEEQKKKRKRKRRRGAKTHAAEAGTPGTEPGEVQVEIEEKGEPADTGAEEGAGPAGGEASVEEHKKKRRRKRRRGPKSAGAEEQERAGEGISEPVTTAATIVAPAVEPVASGMTPEKPKKVARPARKKVPAPVGDVAAVPVPETLPLEETGGPVKATRARKSAAKKKPETPGQMVENAPEMPKPAQKKVTRKKSVKPAGDQSDSGE
jgi:ribonuclease E